MRTNKIKRMLTILCICCALCVSTGLAVATSASSFSDTLVGTATENAQTTIAQTAQYFDLQKDYKRNYNTPTSGDSAEESMIWIRWNPNIEVNDAKLGTINKGTVNKVKNVVYGAMDAQGLEITAATEESAAKTLGDLMKITVQKDAEEAVTKTFTEWKGDESQSAMRLDVYENYIGIYVSETNAFARNDIESITLCQGLCPVATKTGKVVAEHARGSWADVAEIQNGGLKSDYALPADITFTVNNDSRRLELATKSIVLKTNPEKVRYGVGEKMETAADGTKSKADLKGLTATATLSDDSAYELVADDLARNYTYESFETAGEKTVTCRYGGATFTFTVTVKNPTAYSEATEKLDLTKSFERQAGEVGSFGGKTIWFDWKGNAASVQTKAAWGVQNMACGEENQTVGDLIVLEDKNATSKTFNEWKGDGQVARVLIYGQRVGINVDDISTATLRTADIVSVTLKKGLAPLELTQDSWNADVQDASIGRGASAHALQADVKLYVNQDSKKLEFYKPTLAVTTQPTKTAFMQHDTFTKSDLADIAVTATTTDNDTFILGADDLTFSADFSETGSKQVTVSYGGATTAYDVTVTAPEKVLTGIAANFTITANKFALPDQFAIPQGGKIVASYTDDTAEDIPFALSMLGDLTPGAIDTSTAGDKTLTVSYTAYNVTKTCTVTLKVSETAQDSAISGIHYGASGVSAVENQRAVPFALTGTLQTHITYDQHTCKSLLPHKTMADLIEVKFANDDKIYKGSENIGLYFRAYGTSYFMYLNNKPNNADVEWVRLKAGFLLYNSATDKNTNDGSFFPLKNADGAYAYLSRDMYLTWTSNTAPYGTVEKPIKNLQITVGDTAITEYYPGEPLVLDGITYSADYLDPAESENVTGAVTADMCSPVPDTAGSAHITVRVKGATATFPITVKVAEKQPVSISLNDASLLTYNLYAIEPNIADGCKLIITYDNETSAEADMRKEWITVRPDTSVAGEKQITISYKEFGKTVTGTATVSVSETEAESNIQKVDFEASAVLGSFGHLRIPFIVGGTNDASFKAIGNIGSLPAVQTDKTLADLIMIKFTNDTEIKSLADWNTEFGAGKHIVPAFYGKSSLTFMDTDKVPAAYGNIEYMIIKAGFIWYTADADAYNQAGNVQAYFPVAENIVTRDMYAGFVNNVIVKPVKEITVNLPDDYKTLYYAGEPLSTIGVTLTVKYVNPKSKDETISLTAAMCGAVIGDTASATAQVSYMGKTYTVEGLTLSPDHISGIVIKTQGKTQYSFAVEDFDISDYEAELIISDVDGTEVKRVPVDASTLTVRGYDSHTLGTQNIKFAYAGCETATFEIEVVNDQPEKHLSIDYISSYASYENTKLDAMVVHTGLVGIPSVQFATLGKADALANVADKVLINGKLASELIADGTLAEIRFWTDQICFFFNTDRMQATKNPTGGHGSYTEGVTELVETVTFLPGFQLYFCSENHWDGAWKESDVTAIKHGVVKETITLVNVGEGMGWMRELKKNAQGTAEAQDAITIGSMPNKTTFTVGDKVTASDFMAGLKLHFKYSDGGEEDIAPSLGDIEFDDDITASAGKKTVTVYFKDNDHFVTFEVTVNEKTEGKKRDKGCGCAGCGSTLASVSVGVGALLLLASSILIVRRKKESE